MLKFIAVILIAYQAHYFWTNHTHRDVLVFIKASKNIDVKALKMLSHTHSVFTVKRSGDAGAQWDHAVLAKGFLSDESRNAYVSTLSYFTFIEITQQINIHADMATYPIFLNVVTKISKIIGNIFGYLPSRPLKPQVPPYVNCSTVDIAKDESMFAMSLMKLSENKTAVYEFGMKFIIMKIFPVLNAEFVYSGEREMKGPFNIVRYDNVNTFCEYVLSEAVIQHGQDYLNAFTELEAYTAGELN